MKIYKLMMVAACIASVTGCNSGSSKSSSPITTTKSVTPAKTERPVADHNFSNSELEALLTERNQILTSVKMSFEGRSYNQVKYAEKLDEGQWVLKLQDSDSNTIDLWLSNADDGDCLIYQPSVITDIFKCGESTRTSSDNSTVIQAITQNKKSNIQVEFQTDALEHIGSIGNTVLIASDKDNKVTINTSFAFSDFFREVLKNDGKNERINATLGVTTYLQMKDITGRFESSEMTLAFSTHIGGSADDDINMYTGLLIRDNKMTTLVTRTGSVFSGGTDLFAAGDPRILQKASDTIAIEDNKQIGVHSWGNGEKTALDIPYTDASHRKQATYFEKMMGQHGIDFYIFTLKSAPFNGEHWLTQADSDKYHFITAIE
ncbi:alpha/beta hydrolase [Pseudoalteromonas rubra]|uniref:Alpha/beta hydrolase n=1 Tax=Pseudoalteromonas rubra TaxID=43658 RepID=A0A5S3WV64_9GAMM|nr:alpha/beta hydrolase [Pseudoalteromonas rubra]TMP32929.1 alpha/beta hydrolase [Pseudoalteromonas rubra]